MATKTVINSTQAQSQLQESTILNRGISIKIDQNEQQQYTKQSEPQQQRPHLSDHQLMNDGTQQQQRQQMEPSKITIYHRNNNTNGMESIKAKTPAVAAATTTSTTSRTLLLQMSPESESKATGRIATTSSTTNIKTAFNDINRNINNNNDDTHNNDHHNDNDHDDDDDDEQEKVANKTGYTIAIGKVNTTNTSTTAIFPHFSTTTQPPPPPPLPTTTTTTTMINGEPVGDSSKERGKLNTKKLEMEKDGHEHNNNNRSTISSGVHHNGVNDGISITHEYNNNNHNGISLNDHNNDDDHDDGQDGDSQTKVMIIKCNSPKYDDHNHDDSDHNVVNDRQHQHHGQHHGQHQHNRASHSGGNGGGGDGENGQANVDDDDDNDHNGSPYHSKRLENISLATRAISLQAKADCASAPTDTTIASNADNKENLNVPSTSSSLSSLPSHVVKIQIKPNESINENVIKKSSEKQVTVLKINNNNNNNNNYIDKHLENNNQKSSLNVNRTDLRLQIEKIAKAKSCDKMVLKSSVSVADSGITINGHNATNTSGSVSVTDLNSGSVSGGGRGSNSSSSSHTPFMYYSMMSSGQFSPCETLDSGTGSDLESNGHHLTAKCENLSNGNDKMVGGPTGVNGKSAPKLELHLTTTKVVRATPAKVTAVVSRPLAGEHLRASSLTDSEESEASSLSCDSLHSNEYASMRKSSPLAPGGGSFLPDSLLRDIRDRKFPTNDFVEKYGTPSMKRDDDEGDGEGEGEGHRDGTDIDDTAKFQQLQAQEAAEHSKFLQECGNAGKRSSQPGKTFIINHDDGTFVDTKMNSMPRKYEADKFYNFHVHEHENFRSFGNGNGNGTASLAYADEAHSLLEFGDGSVGGGGGGVGVGSGGLNEDVFAGYKDIRCGSAASTIRSSKGTVRGVKNRVRNGIATFLQLQQPNIKNYKEKDYGKVVLYTTSMGIIRDTFAKCSNIKKILRTLLVKFEERDVFMSVEYQQEIKERMHSDIIKVPQLFVEGQHIGDAETVERLNESGELRQLLKPYKSIATTYTCQTCGGYRLLPCPSCNGSKKSVHRNHFTAEFVALKCMNCDEVGLVKCHNC